MGNIFTHVVKNNFIEATLPEFSPVIRIIALKYKAGNLAGRKFLISKNKRYFKYVDRIKIGPTAK